MLTRLFIWGDTSSLWAHARDASGQPTLARRADAQAPALKDRVALDLLEDLERARAQDAPLRVIIQLHGPLHSLAASLPQRFPMQVHRTLKSSNALVATVRAQQLTKLAQDASVRWISPDRVVTQLTTSEPIGHIAVTTGMNQVAISAAYPSRPSGDNITIGIIDSGTCHWCDPIWSDDGISRSMGMVELSGENLEQTDPGGDYDGGDIYGHGFHVTSIATGNGYLYGMETDPAWEFGGIARGARSLSFRVLDSEGKGYASNVIEGIEQAVDVMLYADPSLRVINLSLGTAPKESYRTDPLCKATTYAVQKGLVVVVAAGNYGMNEKSQIVHGGILSPAIDPNVITVGAVDTKGTNTRTDDVITTFSSRGPTLGCTGSSISTCDLLPKPDLVAPGANIIAGAYPWNHLSYAYPKTCVFTYWDEYAQQELCAWGSLLRLNGTSMAAPMVSGTVALMLDANPSLTPALIKAILQYTAIPVHKAGVLDSTSFVWGGSVVQSSTLVTPSSSLVDGQSMTWGTTP
ncbi:MAG: S8 family serine peptidase [Myxococcota bacterium]